MRTARIVGALFLVAMITSLVGGGLIETTLEAPDYLRDAYGDRGTLALGAVLELVNAAAIIGIAITMFPILKRYGEALALGYASYRVVEAAVIAVSVIFPLAIIALSQEYSAAGSADASGLEALGAALTELRARVASLLIPVFFSLGAVIFYGLLYQSRLVPRFISVWGLIGVALILAFNLLETFGVEVTIALVLALPIIVNEVFLGIWLIVKGFDPVALGPAMTSEQTA